MIGPFDTAPGDEPMAPAKVDPETLALRARRAPAIRFKRAAIVGLAGLVSTAVVATTWFALQPRRLHLVTRPNDDVHAATPTDALSALPKTYAETPRLGPPLPGDLGRSIVDHQQALVPAGTGASASPTSNQAVAARRERLAAELKAARESGLLVRSERGSPALGPASPSAPAAPSSPAGGTAASAVPDPEHDPNAQQRKIAFVATLDKDGDTNPHVMRQPVSPYLLSAGSVIAASLITGLKSDLPGQVIAQVTERVFDSATGRIELIPQGARLIGSYDSVVAFGQQRALVVWQRLILPDGSSLALDNVPPADPSGYAGLADKVYFHTWALLKGVAVSTVLGVGSNLTFTRQSDLVQAIRESTQQNVSRAGDQLTSRNLRIQPTITIRPGAPVRLVVHRDLILAPWRE